MVQHASFLLLALCLVLGTECRKQDDAPPESPAAVKKTIEQVQRDHEDQWLVIPGIVGVAIGRAEDRPCIAILVSSNLEEVRRRIPGTVEGYPIIFHETGTIRALDML